MRPFFISIQGSYSQLELALFNGERLIQTFSSDKAKASSHLVQFLDTLLSNHDLTLSDLDFICLDKGPGAFTSLRVVVATVNGIGFARKLPLIGIDGLEALAQQARAHAEGLELKNKPEVFVSLLNAYNNDVYFLAEGLGKAVKGCEKVEVFLEQILSEFPSSHIFFSGNAVLLHEQEIKRAFGEKALIPEDVIAVASARQIGQMGYQEWQQKKDPVFEIVPNYMKTQRFAIKK